MTPVRRWETPTWAKPERCYTCHDSGLVPMGIRTIECPELRCWAHVGRRTRRQLRRYDRAHLPASVARQLWVGLLFLGAACAGWVLVGAVVTLVIWLIGVVSR